jgi:hypothetical protein
MDSNEYFKAYYKGIHPLYYNVVSDEIHQLLMEAFTYEGKCVDVMKYNTAKEKCEEAYKQLLPYREQIASDFIELEGRNGFSFLWDFDADSTNAIQSMEEICLLAEDKFGIHLELSDTESSAINYQESVHMTKGVDEEYKKAVGTEIYNFKLEEPLNKVELDKLYTFLVKDGFVSRESKIEDLSHVLGGSRPDDYKRIGWIKLNRNKTINKKSVLTFLRCLEVDWRDINPKKLNYCFDVGKDFNYNNLKDSKSFNGNKGINASSDALYDLYEVMSMVFGEDSERYKRIKKIPLMQNNL